jgi:predicted transcriptional regulator
MTSTTMTIRVSAEVHDKLSRLAQATRRSRSDLAGKAVAAYVERELAIVEGIMQGLADAAAGRVTPHEEVMAHVHAIIDDAERKRAGRG